MSQMSKAQRLELPALVASGENYLVWTVDMKLLLTAEGLASCIQEDACPSEKMKYQAVLLMRYHLSESLKSQYLTMEDPLDLWIELKSRYNNYQEEVLILKKKRQWHDLRFQDFKSVEEYHRALFDIVSFLRLSGEEITDADLIAKTISTLDPRNFKLQKAYNDRGFETHDELIHFLFIAEYEKLLKRGSVGPVVKQAKRIKEVKRKTCYGHSHSRSRKNGHGDDPISRSDFSRYDGSGRGQGRASRSDIGRDNFGYNRYKRRGVYKPRHSAKYPSYNRFSLRQ